MKALLRTLLLARSGRISKAKAVALLAGAVNVANASGLVTIPPEDLALANTALVALFGVFLRHGIADP